MFFSRTRLLSALLASATLTAAAQTQGASQPDLTKDPTLYAVGYAHLDTEWRWEYPQVIDEYLRKTLDENFRLIDKYPHYIFNFSGANRYRMMKEYYPERFERLKQYVAQGRWFPAGSSVEEGDVNSPDAEAILRQILYGNEWFHKNFGKASEEYMLPDCFGFPSSLPSILAHAGVKGFSTQKLTWGSSANVGGPESLEHTPEGTPFNVGVWVGPDGKSVLAAMNPGAYNGGIYTDLSKPLPELPENPALMDIEQRLAALEPKLNGASPAPADMQEYFSLRSEQAALQYEHTTQEERRFQGDWAARVLNDGKVTGVQTDYHYYGTGDIGGAPSEESVKRLEAIVTKGSVDLPPANSMNFRNGPHTNLPVVSVGQGPVRVISATSDQMFKDITPAEEAELPRYTGELELTNHSAGSLTSQAYQKRWIRQEELLADAAEKSSITANWLGGRSYPQMRLNDAWTLAMGAHFHDLAAGTATPRAYEFAWNDDVLAMNQFADVLKSATDTVTQALDTEGAGVPVVVFNPLNVARQDLVEAAVDFRGKEPKGVRVTGPDGQPVPAQLSEGKVIFAASVPSVGYAVYHVEPAEGSSAEGNDLHVTANQLENAFYRVTLNSDGDVSSIFDKQANHELLAAPARLALSYDNPEQWPAWNMDWTQEQAKPREYVSGPAKIRVVENGPARVAIEVTRDTAGSHFVQTIRLSTGDAGKRVEFANVIDWNTRERNLKASFPLTASNEMATYNWDIGTIQRPTAQPKKFEVPSHQWIDLTDASGTFGTTVLTDAKNGSDKPDDHTLRLTLIVTPGVAGGYPDQATQDIGHHEFIYGLAGHADGWRAAQTDWQGQRMDAPLLAFAAPAHPGTLGKTFSMLKVSNDRVRVLALKKAEDSDEVIVRLVELDGKPQSKVQIHFAAPLTAAREVNGQEQALGAADVQDGALVTSFTAYQPRTFAVKLGAAPATVNGVQSAPVSLHYDLATASMHDQPLSGGLDGKGDAYPAEMLPEKITFNDVVFQLAPAKASAPNAVVARGQRLELPSGQYNRVYLLAAADDGDQKAAFEAGNHKAELNIENWGGLIGQWDDRVWSGNPAEGGYGEMTGLKPGFIKRADVAWYSDHHHDAKGANVAYGYSYLFAYSMDLPSGAKTLRLPNNPHIRILAVSVANEGVESKPLQPLYDELPAAHTGPADFSMTAPKTVPVSQGRTATARVLVLPRGDLHGAVRFKVAGLPSGVSASFAPSAGSDSAVMTLTASKDAAPAEITATLTGEAEGRTHSEPLQIAVSPILKNTRPVDLSSDFNVTGIYTKGTHFPSDGGLDGGGAAFPAEALGKEAVGAEVYFHLGPPNAPDAVSSRSITLPAGHYSSLRLLATAVEGNQRNQNFTVTYADGSTASVTQGITDWSGSAQFKGESPAVDVPYRIGADGSVDPSPFYLSAFTLPLDSSKEVRSVTLPSNHNVLILAATLVTAGQ